MSDRMLNAEPFFPVTVVMVILFLLFIFLVYKELQRKQKFIALRIVGLSLVIISLSGLFLRPAYFDEKNQNAILLLTKGYQQSKVDSIIQRNPKLKIITTKDAASYSNSSTLKSWYELNDENIFCVVGQGIPSHALDLLQYKTFQFIPASLPRGITKLTVPNNLCVNDLKQIHGTFNAAEKTKLKLIGPGGIEDSVTMRRGEVFFSLSFKPKQSGQFIYSFLEEDSSGSTSIERLPLEVLPERQLRILFIQKFPTAEVRFLKNFLAGKSHAVAIRYQVSKNNFTYEYANTTPMRMDILGAELLNSFDVLFMDQKSYDELTTDEKLNLKKSIQHGLGVIFLFHDQKEKVLNDFFSLKSRISLKDTAHIRLSSTVFEVPVLQVELNMDASIRAVTQSKNRVLSGYFFFGEGRVGFQFIQETFRFGMSGHADDYSALWTTLIEKIARVRNTPFKLRMITPFPFYPNEPIDIATISSGPHPSLYTDSSIISMKENAVVDDYWTGRDWAGKSGWHQFQVKQDSTQLNYFVSDTTEWKTLRISNQMRDNRISQNISINDRRKVYQRVQVPKLLFYLIFLFSSAFLWLAPKI